MSEQDDGDGRGGVPLTRRQLVAGAAGTVIGGTAGALYVTQGASGLGGPSVEQVEPEEPKSDGDATLGELYWLLENAGEEHARIDVSEFVYSAGTIDVTYRSSAEDAPEDGRWNQHLDELGHVIRMYAEYVQQDGPDLTWATESGGASGDDATSMPTTTAGDYDESKGRTFVAHVANPYDEAPEQPKQPAQYGIKRTWVRKMILGEYSMETVFNLVVQSKIGTKQDE